MAKSIRSKRRRKMRAIKRESYGAKELERLKKTLANDKVKKEIDAVMEDISEVVTVTDSKTLKENTNTDVDIEKMDDDSVKHIYNKRTLRDQYGTYPVWMNQRRVRKEKKTKVKKQKAKSKKKK